ncbi:helix-turn-helix transcriptional regulator [Microbacterium sp. RD1]|uniref:helix-turn-helix transcriptional regulator n=1 Tax=Microbacterium sp. RD1 TaxID=3457313 RepID=UPI003FA6075E
MTTTTSRLLEVLSLLQARPEWPGSTLARRLDISPRTVRRDIERLRDMGYRISARRGPDGGYRLEAGSELPPLHFDDEQVLALAVALRTATNAGAGVEEAALRALTTVRQVMPQRLRHRLDAIEFTSLAAPAASVAPSPEVLVTVSAAVRARHVLRFDYGDPESDRPPRRTEPHGLVAAAGRWYLVAWDLDRDDWRIYRVDRLSPRTPTGPRFSPRDVPGGDLRTFVAGRFRGAEAGGDWPCVGSVVLRLPARDVLPFVGDGVVAELGPRRCRVTAGSWSWIALAAWFARFDAPFQVESPPELSDAVRDLATRLAASAPAPASET